VDVNDRSICSCHQKQGKDPGIVLLEPRDAHHGEAGVPVDNDKGIQDGEG
jgi:hypothetical protein